MHTYTHMHTIATKPFDLFHNLSSLYKYVCCIAVENCFNEGSFTIYLIYVTFFHLATLYCAYVRIYTYTGSYLYLRTCMCTVCTLLPCPALLCLTPSSSLVPCLFRLFINFRPVDLAFVLLLFRAAITAAYMGVRMYVHS